MQSDPPPTPGSDAARAKSCTCPVSTPMENDLEERVARAICAYWCAEAGKMLGEFDPCIFSKRKSACKSWPNEIGCARVAIAAMRDSADEKARTE